ncbi:BRO-N domain-containing protein [Nostoc sp.]|uniref:BRO-N domain-containing protein n=1 Tax=Nostoc sp. TaxID=1180 RepID=UPI002FFA82DB
MSNLSVFNFESHEIRFVGTADDPWWVAKDICEALGIKNDRQATGRLDDNEKDVTLVDTLGGKQQTTTVNESGLWSLVLASRKPETKRFKKWLTSEVIPAICKTGSYSAIAPTQPQPQLPSTANARLDELATEENFIRQQIKDIEAEMKGIESRLSAKRKELQDVMEEGVKEALAFKRGNPEAMKQALRCQQILDRAKDMNPMRSVK